MKNYIIKTKNLDYYPVKADYFNGRLERQTALNLLSDKKPFAKSDLKNAIANYVQGIVALPFDINEIDEAILKSCTDDNGIYLKDVYEAKRRIFWEAIFNKLKTKS